MGFDRAPCHFQLLGDFFVIAALQQQICDLLLARSKTNELLRHDSSPGFHGFSRLQSPKPPTGFVLRPKHIKRCLSANSQAELVLSKFIALGMPPVLLTYRKSFRDFAQFPCIAGYGAVIRLQSWRDVTLFTGADRASGRSKSCL